MLLAQQSLAEDIYIYTYMYNTYIIIGISASDIITFLANLPFENKKSPRTSGSDCFLNLGLQDIEILSVRPLST